MITQAPDFLHPDVPEKLLSSTMLSGQEITKKPAYSLQMVAPEKFITVLQHFEKIVPFPLLILDLDGTVRAASPTLAKSAIATRHFRIDSDAGLVQEETSPGICTDAILSAPILVHGDVIGYVLGDISQPLEDEKTYRNRLQAIAEMVGDKTFNEYELTNLTEELLEKYSEVTLIYDISEALSAVFDPKTVCDIIIKQIVDVVGVERASLMLYDERQNYLYIMSSHGLGLPPEKLATIHVTPGEKTISGWVFETGKPFVIENIDKLPLPDISLGGASYKKKSFLSIPIIFNSMNMERKVMGVINMADKRSDDVFTAGDQRLLTTIASQAAMALYNIQLIEKVKDTERMRREMEIAQQIQLGLLPGEPPQLPGLQLAGRCFPATQVGGDYYDFFRHAEYEFGVVIADVSGHDVGSAFIMATARSALRSEALARKSPARILKDTNLVLYEDLTKAQKFITMFYAEYNSRSRTLCYANAAQNPPILVRNRQCMPLDTEGFFIGMWDSTEYEEKTVQLEPQDFVILYTDGVVEAKNEVGEMFSAQHLLHVLETIRPNHSAGDVLDTIYAEVERFTRNMHRSDDITVVVLKIQE